MIAATALLLLAVRPVQASAPELAPGAWRAVLESPGGELPFGLDVTADGVFVVNGAERIRVPEVRSEGGALALDFPHYDARITARVTDGGNGLEGEWTKRVGGAAQHAGLPFRAARGEAPRFAPDAASADAGATGARSVDGRWRVSFASSSDPAVGLFESDGELVRGTFLTTTGDYRYLAGSLSGDRLRLSTFDGAHAFLFDARLSVDGSLQGEFWSRDSWHERWVAVRDETVELPDPFAASRWNPEAALADLVFSDVDGNPRSVGELVFGARATIVQVLGTWCPNCNDETSFLKELHAERAGDGLAIVGLAFELSGDFARDAAQVRVYAERRGVEYPLLIAGTADKQRASGALPWLDEVRAFPTTIFLDNAGRARAVHTGFSGPATGEAHERLVRSYLQQIDELLAEPLPADGADWLALRGAAWTSADRTRPYRVDLRETDAGLRTASVTADGEEREQPVELYARSVRIGERTWRWDRRARVLLDPTDFGMRLRREGGSATPLLSDMGLVSWREAASALDHPDPLARREGLVARALGGSLRPAKGEIDVLLRDPNPSVRTAAAWAAGHVRDADALDELLALTDSPFAPLRREVARALEKYPDERRVAEALERMREDADPIVRGVARGE